MNGAGHLSQPIERSATYRARQSIEPRVVIVDEDVHRWAGIEEMLGHLDVSIETSTTIPGYFLTERPQTPICLIMNVRGGRSELQFLKWLKAANIYIPVVFLAEIADVAMSVEAMKSGAIDFLCRPFRSEDLIAAVEAGLARDKARCDARQSSEALARRFEMLSPRERQVMEQIVEGKMNKQIAFTLGISEITVKAHRGQVMRKMNARSLPELTRIADALSRRSAWVSDGAAPDPFTGVALPT